MKKSIYVRIVCLSSLITFCAMPAFAVNSTPAPTETNHLINDQHLEYQINKGLSSQVPKGSFTVVSYQGDVLVAGQVPNAKDKSKAATAVTNTEGVKTVWNYVTIGANETAGDISRDAYLTSAAKTRLIAQKNVNTNNIKVVTCNKVVYLLGSDVGDAEQIKHAVIGIKSIDGVQDVINLIRS